MPMDKNILVPSTIILHKERGNLMQRMGARTVVSGFKVSLKDKDARSFEMVKNMLVLGTSGRKTVLESWPSRTEPVFTRDNSWITSCRAAESTIGTEGADTLATGCTTRRAAWDAWSGRMGKGTKDSSCTTKCTAKALFMPKTGASLVARGSLDAAKGSWWRWLLTARSNTEFGTSTSNSKTQTRAKFRNRNRPISAEQRNVRSDFILLLCFHASTPESTRCAAVFPISTDDIITKIIYIP